MKKRVVWAPQEGAQQRFMTCPAWECLLQGNRGGGKGLLPEEKILTPKGWTSLRKIRPGSIISNPDGTSQSVVQVFNRDKQQMYRIKFADGTSIDCDGDHLWYSKIANRIKGKTIRNYTPLDFYGSIFRTEDLYNLLQKFPHKIPLIPCNDPIKYHQSWKSEIDAYTIGLILGDGCISKKDVRVSSIDEEIIDHLKSLGAKIYHYDGKSAYSCHFLRNSEIYAQVKNLKLLGTNSETKFIPKRLMQGSVNERISLLQGLMDSDGYVSEDGRCSYATVSKKLAYQVRHLILSLGGWSSISKKIKTFPYNGEIRTGKLCYCLYIQFPNKEDLFRLTRKKKRAKDSNYMHGRLVRKMISISKLKDKKNTICIVVNNPNRLFITRGFLVTHNTDTLLMDYAQGVGRGWGPDYKGLLLREATTELGDVISKSKKWYPKMFPGANFNGQRKIWTFPDGETLWLNYARVLSDYDQYHGHEYPWIGWEELTNHAVDEVYLKLMSCNRTSNPLIVKKYRSTCNPAGPGHAWVKRRFIDTIKSGRIYKEMVEVPVFDEKTGDLVQTMMEVTRSHIFSDIRENKMLIKADPLYIAKIMQMTKDDEMLRKAWIDGSWDLVIGGFFTDVWVHDVHVLPYFEIPKSWYCFRSFDWGSSKPWCVSYIVECNGEQPYSSFELPYFPKGTSIVINELYGWNGYPNQGDMATSQQISDRVRDMDDAILQEHGLKVHPGPADTSIYDVKDGTSIGIEMAKYKCHWTRAHKGSGSRVTGWALIRQMLGAAKRRDLESAHLYFFSQAQHHIRTIQIMQRDPKKPEDIDSDLEDHPCDSMRYGLSRKSMKISMGQVGI